ncbi:MAG TPA: sigma-70 family RNA polymerase sigma factor [Thermomicrobiales bacterium]|jgi:RNA polymerase sigma-70 factor (ECF subfamily)
MWRRGHSNGHDADDPASGEPLDEELVALRSILDPAAFAPLYRRYLPEILALCTRRLGNQSDAEDATGEIFRKALAKRDTFHGGSFRKWLYTIAINTLRDHADRPAPPVELFATFSDPAPGPEELALQAVGDAEVRVALARLPEEWQLVVELRNQGYRCAEVAAAVGHDADWVRLTHHRALERLARDLGVVRQRRVRHG